MQEEKEDKILLFGPKSGKSLLRLYPELAENKIFKDLSQEDLNFAWYAGNQSSPIDEDTDDYIRYRMAAGVCILSSEEKKRRYASGVIPDEVKAAINKMKNYSPDARALAKKMTQQAFHNFQKMLNVDVEKDFLITRKIGKGEDAEEITEIDWTGRKSYVDSATKIISELPELVKKMEEGYGVVVDKKSKEEIHVKGIDRFHNTKKD
jgi:hypothetical protein